MGFFDSVTELLWTEAYAKEAPKEEEEKDEESSEDTKEEGEGEDGGDEKEDDKEDEPEEEEEEEEEMVDPKEKLEEECTNSKVCSAPKHHFDECVERVTGAGEHSTDKKHPDENCVEEFFHLAHCATNCAAPKLWSSLK